MSEPPSKKRTAERQITKDDSTDESVAAESGTWKRASEETIAKRQIVTAKRKLSTPAQESSFPTFNFGAPKPSQMAEIAAQLHTKEEKNKIDPAPVAREVPREGEAAKAVPQPGGFVNAFLALVPKDVWTCKSCDVPNKNTLTKCAACETVRPDSKAPNAPGAPSSSPAFSFGISPSATGAVSSTFGAPLSFGITIDSATTSGSAPLSVGAPLSFGITKDTTYSGVALSPSGVPPFGSSYTSGSFPSFGFATSGESCSFGSVAETGASGFAFGTRTGALDFASSSMGFTTEPVDNKASELFDESKAQSSGTSDDKTILKIRAKVFKLTAQPDSSVKKYMEIGIGDLCVNTIQKDGDTKCRLVMRTEKTQRGVLNAPIFKSMKYKIENDKNLSFLSNDLDGTLCVHLLKFKTGGEAQECKQAIEQCLQLVK